MYSQLKYWFSVAALLIFSIIVPAQTLPPLPLDKSIEKGRLSCGVTYYMVKAPQDKGFAELAVVQKDSPLTDGKKAALQTDFLGRMGIAAPATGFLREQDGATVYRLSRIPVYRAEVLDSTLLYAFARLAASQSRQALVVAGDIDPVELKKKMDIFSLLVPPYRGSEQLLSSYVWQPDPAPRVSLDPGGVSGVEVSYASARVPQTFMNTAQAQVADIFQREFMLLLHHRLERNLWDAGVPFTDIRLDVSDSAEQGGDERYWIRIQTAPAFRMAATEVLAATLAEADAFGMSAEEFSDGKRVLRPRILRQASEVPSQQDWTERCVANFLYDANLAPFSETARLFARKRVSEAAEARFLNNFTSAVLEQLSNLDLKWTAAPDSLDDNDILFRYNLSWLYASLAPSGKEYRWRVADSTGLVRQAPRAKISKEKPEALTGGTLWTFSNGVRVAYKEVPGSGMFSYALQLDGGLSQIPDLREGEGGYIAPLLSLCTVGGIPAHAFQDLLQVNGIRLDAKADLNNLIIRGDAPSDKLELVIHVLLSLANERQLEPLSFQRYAQNEAIREESMESRLESLFYPGFVYTTRQRPQALTEDTARKAERYFEERFSQVNNGILILTGDLPEPVLKRMLLRYVGGFRTQKGSSVSRKSTALHPVSGVLTYEGTGPRGLYILMDTEYALTASNYATMQVVEQLFRRALSHELAQTGMAFDVNMQFMAYPQERLRMAITLSPTGPEAVSPEDCLPRVHAALASAVSHPAVPKDLDAWRGLVLQRMNRSLECPETMVTALVARYGAGKDMVSKYAENIKGVSADKVRQMAGSLVKGGRVEYLVP